MTRPASRALALLAVAALVSGRTVTAEAPPASSRPEAGAAALPALVAEALAHSPVLQAARRRVEAAHALVLPAAALPDPMVELMLQDAGFPNWTVGSEPMSMIGPEVRQGLLYPGKRDARRKAAEASAATRSAELELLARRIAADVRTLYARLYALDEEARALAAGRELLEVVAATATSRYATGTTDQEAVLKARLAAARLDMRVEEVRADRAAAAADLNAILGRSAGAAVGRVESLPDPLPPSFVRPDEAAETSAEVLARRTAATQRKRGLEVARLDLKPNLFVAAGLGLRGGFDPVATLRLGVEWPLWSRQKQQQYVAAAAAELEAARADVAAAVNDAAGQASRFEAAWRRDTRLIVLYRESILPLTSAAVDAARAAYLTGGGDFSTVVENFGLWLEARIELARRTSALFTTWALIDALVSPAPQIVAGSEQ